MGRFPIQLGHWYPTRTFLFLDSALITEVVACLCALQWARKEGVSYLQLYTDSTMLVQGLQSDEVWHITNKYTMANIRTTLGKDFLWCQLIKVLRAYVNSAHLLARWCRLFRTYFNQFVFCLLYVFSMSEKKKVQHSSDRLHCPIIANSQLLTEVSRILKLHLIFCSWRCSQEPIY